MLNESPDKHPLPDLLHGNEQRVCGDSTYASEKSRYYGSTIAALDPEIHAMASHYARLGLYATPLGRVGEETAGSATCRGCAVLMYAQHIEIYCAPTRATHHLADRSAGGGFVLRQGVRDLGFHHAKSRAP